MSKNGYREFDHSGTLRKQASIEHWAGSLSIELQEFMESEAIKLSSCFSFAHARVMLITFVLHPFYTYHRA